MGCLCERAPTQARCSRTQGTPQGQGCVHDSGKVLGGCEDIEGEEGGREGGEVVVVEAVNVANAKQLHAEDGVEGKQHQREQPNIQHSEQCSSNW